MVPTGTGGRRLVDSYFDGGFRISGEVRHGSQLITPASILDWAVVDFEAVTEASLEPLAGLAEEIEILLIGTGRSFRPLAPSLRAVLKQRGWMADAMDTSAACRTYNLLASERRPVAAALICR